MNYDFIIIGAGLFGSVIAEQITTNYNKKVLIIDRRSHIGGNCQSEIDQRTGIEFHKYGTHIFHTSKEEAYNYFTKFSKLNNYRHQVLSKFKNNVYQMPINLETINAIYKKNFTPYEAQKFIETEIKKEKINNPKNFEEKAISMVGYKIYKYLLKGYTEKQWGKNPKNLPSTIINRIPVRYNYNEDYFKNSLWQGIPIEGYYGFFKNILKNKKITIKLNYNFNLNDFDPKTPTLYTGPLDSLFENKYGKLEWRSVKFKKKYINLYDFQGNSVINYPDKKIAFTRIHEPRHLHPERSYGKKNIIIYEFPTINAKEPYYPINDDINRKKYKKYKSEAERLKNFFIGGRLADYAYYDMDMTIITALNLYNKKIKKLFSS